MTQEFCFYPEKLKHVYKNNYMRMFMLNLSTVYKTVKPSCLSTREWLNKLRYNGIPLSNNKEQTIAIYSNMNESQKYYAY